MLAHGLGRSYGDSALLSTGNVLKMERLNRILSLTPDRLGSQEAGVSLKELIEIFVPRGFFPPVVPGTHSVTLGGAIANDIHGKNHHVDGTICDHIRALELLLADGTVVTCDRNRT